MSKILRTELRNFFLIIVKKHKYKAHWEKNTSKILF